MVHLVAVEEQDHVGVLLDAAGLADVGHDGALVAARLDLAVQLRQRDDGNLQILGERLEAARDLGQLLHAILLLLIEAAHELQVIDDDDAQVVFAFQAARLGPQFQHVQPGRIVDEDRRFGQPAGGHRQPREVAFGEIAGAHLGVIDTGFGAQQAHDQLLLGHFQGEHADRGARLEGDVLRDVEGEGGFAHAGARRDDDEVRGLQAGGLLVEVEEAGRHAGDHLLAFVQLLDGLDRVHDHVADLEEGGPDALFGHVVDEALGLVEELFDVVLAVVTAPDDLAGHANEAAQHGLVPDDAGVVGDVGGAGHLVAEFGEEGRAADLGQLTARFQRVGQGDEVDGLAALGQGEHGLEDGAVRVAVEIGRGHDLDDAVQGVGVEQDAAEDRLFGLQVLRRHLAQGLFERRHGLLPLYLLPLRGKPRVRRYGPRRTGATTRSGRRPCAGRANRRPFRRCSRSVPPVRRWSAGAVRDA